MEHGDHRGPERERLQQLSEELGLRERVRLLGEIPDVEAWLARAGLVVQPSRFEGFPNAVLEAMALGAAVISADCPAGPAELIRDGLNGRLVPVEDVPALAQAMRELMQTRARARPRRASRGGRRDFTRTESWRCGKHCCPTIDPGGFRRPAA